jgi:hypothetical protein
MPRSSSRRLDLQTLILSLMEYGIKHDRKAIDMRTVASINRKAMVRARGGLNKGMTLKQIKPQAMPKQGQRRGK